MAGSVVGLIAQEKTVGSSERAKPALGNRSHRTGHTPNPKVLVNQRLSGQRAG